ncbi:hypothetical protein PQ469_12060 [Mucilaginibacter sp. KACC 22773]|uniref:hypothetical protein n=1 Tax=Mucilaginibacter sp. KACC 22773 TaxID=3025671 RepID=UPI0023657A6A|nr:hypothetical protein [Mucilaginibacter sp. KACC 22773]WDF80741.1 hypothetical protein PQ469_12060 [Mucilaginibacter sp. KACC 22773]
MNFSKAAAAGGGGTTFVNESCAFAASALARKKSTNCKQKVVVFEPDNLIMVIFTFQSQYAQTSLLPVLNWWQ